MSTYAERYDRIPPKGVKGRRAQAGLCLSGGGYRAMLFHVGALRRLHEAGGLQPLKRISSVSGGSIAAGVLALAWPHLHHDDGSPDIEAFVERVQNPLVDFARTRIDVTATLGAILTPGVAVSDRVTRAYRSLFGDKTLANLPDEPRFVFLATNLQTGSLVRFARSYTADYQVGVRRGLALPLVDVVAASSAFPPVLSPKVVDLDDDQALTGMFEEDDGTEKTPNYHRKPFTHHLELSDGGVYDNLGLQPLESFHTILASDGGGWLEAEEKVARNWLMHMIRTWKVGDSQVRGLRRSGLIDEYEADEREGTYWAIATDPTRFKRGVIPVDATWPPVLAAVPTRLWRFSKRRRHLLVNWGYAISDGALRTFFEDQLATASLPFPDQPLDQPIPKRSFLARLTRRPPV